MKLKKKVLGILVSIHILTNTLYPGREAGCCFACVNINPLKHDLIHGFLSKD
jgi:hypothetical protein